MPRESPPAREAWIEMVNLYEPQTEGWVASREGGVD